MILAALPGTMASSHIFIESEHVGRTSNIDFFFPGGSYYPGRLRTQLEAASNPARDSMMTTIILTMTGSACPPFRYLLRGNHHIYSTGWRHPEACVMHACMYVHTYRLRTLFSVFPFSVPRLLLHPRASTSKHLRESPLIGARVLLCSENRKIGTRIIHSTTSKEAYAN